MPATPRTPVCSFHSPARPPRYARLVLPVGFLTVMTLLVGRVVAQEEAAQEEKRRGGPESIEIEPYTGPPVFLPAVEAPPPPTEVESKVVTEKFPKSETVRFERRVVRMSDNTIVSDGPHKEYYSSGQLYVTGAFDLGKQTGKWTFYHANGKPAKEITYVSGEPDGEVRLTDNEGKLKAIRDYKDGERDGKWVVYAEDGEQIIAEQMYKAGLPDGEWRSYYKDGQKRQVTYFKEGKRDGLTTEWANSGEKRGEVMFKNGLRDGKATIWQRDGRVIERVYEEGKLKDQKISNPEG